MPEALPNYGLLTGLAQGLQSGFDSYQGARRDQQDRLFKSLAMKLTAAKQGYNIDPDHGLVETPELQAKKQYDLSTSQRGTESNDPTSDRSAAAREMAQGILDSYNPGSGKIISSKMSEADLKDENGLIGKHLTAQAAKSALQTKTGNQFDEQDTKDATAMANSLDADKGRAGNLGQISQRKQQAQVIKTLALDENGNVRNLNPQQVREAATAVAKLINSGGNGAALEQINSLVPKSFVGDLNAKLQYALNSVQGADQQNFVKLLVDTADREGKLADQQMKDIQQKRLSPFMRLQKRNPTLYNNILNSYMSPSPSEDRGPGGLLNSGQSQGQTSSKPTTVKQNGVTYTLNPQTGQYE